jgi:hypothetical protein
MTEMNNMGRAMFALRQINGYGTDDSMLHLDKVISPTQLDGNSRDLIDQWVGDLMGDLRHLADCVGVGTSTYHAWLNRGEYHYDEERAEEEAQARIPTTQQSHDAMTRAPALDVETWNTGGGTMVTYVIVERKGEVITRNHTPDPDGKREATRYIGITHEDEWVICYTDDLFDEGAEYEVKHNLPAYDLDAMLDFVGAMTLACKVFDVTRILEPLVKRPVSA